MGKEENLLNSCVIMLLSLDGIVKFVLFSSFFKNATLKRTLLRGMSVRRMAYKKRQIDGCLMASPPPLPRSI